MALNIQPSTGIFPAAGGEIIFQIHSLADIRLAFKVKSSDNDRCEILGQRPLSSATGVRICGGQATAITANLAPRRIANIEPPTRIFPAAGGEIIFQIHSLADTRLAFKVKSSDNDHYRVRPVYGFVAAKQQQSLQILRLEGSPKEDKFVVQWAEVPDEETDP
ncbi:unnamed protein product, partial [Mesorhabditis belari]|uniref:Major sperm protein n=1 Tax=Mesorhabditis belari TaxID=2138241 RepID=A0AAF3JB85_9BILA